MPTYWACRTSAMACGLPNLSLIKSITIGTLAELAEWTLEADKVLTF